MEKEKIRELVQEIQYSNNRSSEKRIDENQKDQIINEIVQENFPELKVSRVKGTNPVHE